MINHSLHSYIKVQFQLFSIFIICYKIGNLIGVYYAVWCHTLYYLISNKVEYLDKEHSSRKEVIFWILAIFPMQWRKYLTKISFHTRHFKVILEMLRFRISSLQFRIPSVGLYIPLLGLFFQSDQIMWFLEFSEVWFLHSKLWISDFKYRKRSWIV